MWGFIVKHASQVTSSGAQSGVPKWSRKVEVEVQPTDRRRQWAESEERSHNHITRLPFNFNNAPTTRALAHLIFHDSPPLQQRYKHKDTDTSQSATYDT